MNNKIDSQNAQELDDDCHLIDYDDRDFSIPVTSTSDKSKKDLIGALDSSLEHKESKISIGRMLSLDYGNGNILHLEIVVPFGSESKNFTYLKGSDLSRYRVKLKGESIEIGKLTRTKNGTGKGTKYSKDIISTTLASFLKENLI